MSISKTKFDPAFADKTGSHTYWRDPKDPNAKAIHNAKKVAKRGKNRLQQKDSKAKSALAIYEPWMEPGWSDGKAAAPTPAPEPKHEPKPAPKPEPKKNARYKFHDDYTKQVEEERKRKEAEEAQKKKPATPIKKRPDTPKKKAPADHAMDAKEDPDRAETPPPPPKPRTPTPPPKVKSPTPPPSPPPPPQEEGDFGDLYQWVSNGTDEDMNQAEDLLFIKKKR